MRGVLRRPVPKRTLTVLAGPNGSGKSFLKELLQRQAWFHRYPYLNPDEIAKRLGDPSDLSVALQAARQAEAQREDWLAQGQSFVFETVFSAPDKPAFLRRARACGYQLRIFFIGTDNPELNAARVARRVMAGGHDVPIAKIISRYQKSLVQAAEAIPWVDRFYLFDNSQDGVAPQMKAWAQHGHWQVYPAPEETPAWTEPLLSAGHPPGITGSPGLHRGLGIS